MMLRASAWMVVAALGLAILGFESRARADEKANATGTWTWEFKRGDNEPVKITLKLKQDGDKLTGTITGPGGNENEIKEGTVKDGEVSFEVTTERDGQTFTRKYKGKLDGDAIKGKVETNFNGNTRSRDWEAKRA